VNVQTGTPSNPCEALENVGIVVLVGPILADTDNAVEEEEEEEEEMVVVVVVAVVVVGGRRWKLELTSPV
jgi:hypothetical protein